MSINDLSFSALTNQIGDVLTNSWYGILLYCLLFIFRSVVLFPGALLTILGGSIFGIFPGYPIVLFAGTLSAFIPYGVGRKLVDDETETTETKHRFARFIGLLKQNPFQTVLIMRLLYLPYDAVSVLAGSLGINFMIFFLATFIGNLGGTLAYVGIGASIQGDITTGDISLDTNILLFSLVVLVIGLGFSRLLQRFNITHQDVTE